MALILTIAIPTYNRSEQIQKQVRLLLPQLNDQVGLVVYDNCSPVEVSSLFSADELQRFTVVRRPHNIGGDANIARCFELCSTKWLWVLSDDDFAIPMAVQKVLWHINKNPDSIYINLWSNDEGKSENTDQFFRKLSDRSMFSAAFAMSTCLYNMSMIQQDLQHYYKYLSTMLGTLILVIKSVQRTNASCVFANDAPVLLGQDVGWNYKSYIHCSSLILDAFTEKEMQKTYNKTFFLGYHKTNYKLIEINRKSSHISLWQRWKLLAFATSKQGLLNALRDCPLQYCRCFWFTLVGRRFASKSLVITAVLWNKLYSILYKSKLALNNIKAAFWGRKLRNTKEVPIIINNFNRYDMLLKLIDSLTQRGYNNIHIIDNKSTYPPLLTYYKTCPHTVHRFDTNFGYLALWQSGIFKQFKNSYYVYTDADMELARECPDDFIAYFYQIMKHHPFAQKVGFGLKLSDLPDHFAKKPDVLKWEQRFWDKPIEANVYKAEIDTTFALYRPYTRGPADHRKQTLRTGEPYLIRHLPWYIDTNNMPPEELYYIEHSCRSTHWTLINKQNHI